MKKLKFLIPIILLLTVFMTIFIVSGMPASADTSGFYTYTISNGEATITDVDTSISGDVIIPSTLGGYKVTSIGSYAFYNCSSLTSITIPDSVTSIGSYAFHGTAYYNNSHNWENDVLYIDKHLIDAKESLSGEYSIKDGTLNIAISAFDGCKGLTSITIPDSVTSIGAGAFSGCSSLESITLPFVGASNNATTASDETLFGYIFGIYGNYGGIGTSQYYNSSSSSTYYIPTSLNSVTITGGNILYGAFYNCRYLTSITLPDNITSIGDCAFYDCSSLTSITIPDSVTSIGDHAFQDCTMIKSITIPDSVTSIGEFALSGCVSLTSMTIPDKVTSIGMGAFAKCISISSINVSNGNTVYHSTGNCLINTTTKALIAGFKNSIIPTDKSVNSINPHAFYGCTGLTSVTIPDSVTSIGSYAFYNCSKLTSITIPDSVTSIDYYAFAGCSKLTSVYITDITAWCNIKFGSTDASPMYYADNLYLNGEIISGELIIPEDVTSIGVCAFDGCSSLTSVTIPDSVTSIGSYAFDGCTELKKLIIAEGSKTVKGIMIVCDSQLTSVVIPDSVTSIGDSAFSWCSKLTSIKIPASVTSIGAGAFPSSSNFVIYGFAGSYAEEYANENNITFHTITIPSITPAVPTVSNITSSTITLDTVEGYEYSINGVTWQSSNVFTGLSPNTSYTFYQRIAETPSSYASATSAGLSVCTEKAENTGAVSMPILISKTYDTVTIKAVEGYEYSIDGITWQSSNVFTGLSPKTSYTFYQRIAETDKYLASASSTGLSITTDGPMNTVEFAGGNGTSYAPYIVSSKVHLDNVRKYPSAHFTQACNIVFTSSDFSASGAYYNNGYFWNPIGKDSSNVFSGTYDGGGYTIENIKINIVTSNSAYGGLFGYSSGVIKNVTIKNGNISVEADRNSYAGGIVGYTSGSVIACKNLNTTVKAQYAGGIIGDAYCTDTINDCYNSGKVDGTYIGGIVGRLRAPTRYTVSTIDETTADIFNCTNSGNMIKSATSGAYIGGIVGYHSSGTLIIFNCSNSGQIYAEGTDLSSISLGGAPMVGGIVGCSYQTVISDCKNSQKIYGDYAGGIVGYGNAKVFNSTNTGNITGRHCVGGIVGYHNGGSISDCTNSATITGCRYSNGKVVTNYCEAAGGICGAVKNSSSIARSYNTGAIVNGTLSGGIVGIGDAVIECYNSGSVSGTDHSGGICAELLDSNSQVSNCFNTGKVSGKYAAGIVSNLEFGNVQTSYNIGIISSSSTGGYIGAIVAYQTGGAVTDCYYLNNISTGVGYVDYSVSTTPDTVKLTKDQMQIASSFEGFDFDSTWTMQGNEDYLYPELNSVTMIYSKCTHSWNNGSVTKQPSCKEAGVKTYICTACGTTKTESIEKLITHTYDNVCDTTCNVCGTTRTITHTYKTTWSNNDTNHWYECSVCGDKKDVANHQFDNACDTTCNICGLTREVSPHIYDNACDATCNVCEKERTVPHVYDNSEDLICNDCGYERPPYILGDVTEDDTITSDDAIYLLRHTLFPEKYPINQTSDFDGNGEVNSDDAIYLLRHTLFPEKFPLEEKVSTTAVVYAMPAPAVCEVQSSSKDESDE